MIVGIDPGINGAAAALCPERGFLDVIDLPTMVAGKRREIDAVVFLDWLRKIEPGRIVMESVHSFPKQGIAGTFYFGVAVGMLKAACRIHIGHHLELVQPEAWKEYFQLPGNDKEAARQLALRLFPEAPRYLTRKKDHNRAEAMLVARWADRPPIGKDWLWTTSNFSKSK